MERAETFETYSKLLTADYQLRQFDLTTQYTWLHLNRG